MKTILIIDCSVMMLKYAADIIIGRFYGESRVIPATSVGEGMRVLRDDKINVDLIMLEYHMPNVDGMLFLEKIRKENMDIPVIITAFGICSEMIEEAGEFGVAGFLIKPYPESRLVRMLENVLDQNVYLP